jgi:sigma-B regulation protein RsbU (phosphoserine phosphatase)
LTSLVRRIALLLPWMVLAVGLGVGVAARGQAKAAAPEFDATQLRQPTQLAGPWLVMAGDDPAYAQPGFDDSKWQVFDAHNNIGEMIHGQPPTVWYRMHVKVSPGQKDLALEEWYLSRAFEIYCNGELFMKNGQVTPFKPYTFNARIAKTIAAKDIAGGSVVIALRVHVAPNEWSGPGPGMYYNNLSLGTEHELVQGEWLRAIGQNAQDWINVLFGLGLGLVALALYLGQRRQREYLWIFLMTMAIALSVPRTIIELFWNVPVAWDLMTLPLLFAVMLFQTLTFFAFLRVRFAMWLRIYFAVAFVIFAAAVIGQGTGFLTVTTFLFGLVPMDLLLYAYVPFLLLTKWRKGNREAGILLIPSALLSLAVYVQFAVQGGALLHFYSEAAAVRAFYFLFQHPVGPFTLGLTAFGDLLFLFSLTVIVVLRATRMSQEQAVMEHEMEAAREVQQVILPEQIEEVAGFTVESAYEPADQVGGDFFQVLPAGAGGLLLVLGDVAGHGLPAAMLVSVLVGAIRASADYTKDPVEMLTSLNERLIGRTHNSFSTALVALITADGWVTVANAGHLSPYLDGREMELRGALPLGVAPNAEYETTDFWVPPGGRLTFYSDGVVEARDATGALFGFDRAQAISTDSAAEIVAAAKDFGQEDDITVVTIARHAAIAMAA